MSVSKKIGNHVLKTVICEQTPINWLSFKNWAKGNTWKTRFQTKVFWLALASRILGVLQDQDKRIYSIRRKYVQIRAKGIPGSHPTFPFTWRKIIRNRANLDLNFAIDQNILG